MKLGGPTTDKFRRPDTPTWIKLAIAGTACLMVGIERRLFLVIGLVLVALAWLSWRGDSQRLS